MTRVLAIDPGTTESAYVVFDGERVISLGLNDNGSILDLLLQPELVGFAGCELAIEMVESFGMAVGKEVFETVFWIGRFCQGWATAANLPFARVTRREVKMHLCQNSRAKDANIRQALIDKLGPQGTKKAPGPTYGMRSHLWSALAVAVTFAETKP